ncbi:hypothetical protein [Burkholderia anthina]|uniref:hypothetical protein n=1 Tax=Burkholderia anthina TaxID=179879 RepID=UPI00292DFD63|nr:hypothetical protein [Burkholderia anthina]
MALVTFYNSTPSDTQVASDLSNDEIVVFTHTRTGGRLLADQVQALVDFNVNLHHENTVPKWNGEDYFVMVKDSFDYSSVREKLRVIAVAWTAAEYPDQVRHL